jgi:hypothetical protein
MEIFFTRNAECKQALKQYVNTLRGEGIVVQWEDTAGDGVDFEFEDAGGSILVTFGNRHTSREDPSEDPWDRDHFAEAKEANRATGAQLPTFVLRRIWKTMELLANEEEAAATYLALVHGTASLRG